MLGDVTAEELTRIVAESIDRPAMPYLHDEAVRLRAMEVAGRQGLMERIDAELADDGPIHVLPYSLFRQFRTTGNRGNYERLQRWRTRQLDLAAMAVFLGRREKAPFLEDLLWSECELTWWGMAAHEHHGVPIDLRVAMTAADLAMVTTLLPHRINWEVFDRVRAEIRRRVLDEYLSPDRSYWWKRHTNNWNAVCNGAIGIAAMLVERDPERLGRVLRGVLESLPAFLSGFADDGGCSEGPGYWRYGFGWYLDFAATLHDFTGGRINIMGGEKLRRICRYPLAVSVGPGEDLTFSDSAGAFLSPAAAARINRFHDLPEVFGLCQPGPDGGLAVNSLKELLLYDGRKHPGLDDRQDYHLPDLGVVKVRSGRITLGAKAGHNDEHHNHNDVGSFLLHAGRSFFLTDPGRPVYSARTFSPRRYESVFCNSFGHSVPVINGRLQPEGGVFAGSMAVEGLSGGGVRRITIEMAGAYPAGLVDRLTRVIEVPPDGGPVLLADTFALPAPPQSLEEAFITALPAEAAPDGASVTIRSETDGRAELRTIETPGRFRVDELTAESAESPKGELIRRIVFTPATLAGEMTLRFSVAVRG